MKLCAQCPAAELLAGPPLGGPAVICRAAVTEAKKTDEILHGVSASPLVTSRKDPSTFFGFCVGTGVPRATDDLSRPHGHYTFCPVWEAEKKRIWENKELMRAPRRPGLSPAAEAALSGIEQGDALEEWMAEDRVRA